MARKRNPACHLCGQKKDEMASCSIARCSISYCYQCIQHNFNQVLRFLFLEFYPRGLHQFLLGLLFLHQILQMQRMSGCAPRPQEKPHLQTKDNQPLP